MHVKTIISVLICCSCLSSVIHIAVLWTWILSVVGLSFRYQYQPLRGLTHSRSELQQFERLKNLINIPDMLPSLEKSKNTSIKIVSSLSFRYSITCSWKISSRIISPPHRVKWNISFKVPSTLVLTCFYAIPQPFDKPFDNNLSHPCV